MSSNHENVEALRDAVAAKLGVGTFVFQPTGAGFGVGAEKHVGRDGTYHLRCHDSEDALLGATEAVTSWVALLLEDGDSPNVPWVLRCRGCGRPVVAVGDDAAHAAAMLLDVPTGVS